MGVYSRNENFSARSSSSSSSLVFFLTTSLLVSASFAQTLGWDCYKCSSTTDELCITNPEAISSGDVTVGNCTGYCTITRTEFTDIPGKAVSLFRDCEQKPLIINEIRTDAHYTTYYKACQTNKCNTGDGIFTPGRNDGGVPSEVITVPEKSSGYQLRAVSTFPLFILTLLLTC